MNGLNIPVDLKAFPLLRYSLKSLLNIGARGPTFQSYQDTLQNLAIAIQRECPLHRSTNVEVGEEDHCHPKEKNTPDYQVEYIPDHYVDEENQDWDEEECHDQEEESLFDHQDKSIESDLEHDPREEHGVNKENLVENDALTSEVQASSTHFKDIKFHDTLCEGIEKGDPISSLEISIDEILHVEKGEWNMSGQIFDKYLNYDTDDDAKDHFILT